MITVDDVPEDTTMVVQAETPEDEVDEVLLTRVDGEVKAYLNRCQHWTDVRLDRGDGAEMRNGEIICEKHAAMFRVSDGLCTHGPCEGAMLPEVSVAADEGIVVLENGYRLLRRGSIDEDGEGDLDRGSRGGDDF